MAEVMTQPPKLVVKYRGGVVKECLIEKPELTIGRKPENDIVIDDGSVSGCHAKIVKIQAVYFIEDLQSTNGTLVNGHKIDRKQLRDADVVTIGEHRLVFLEETRNQASAASPTVEASDHTVVLKTGLYGAPKKVAKKVGVLQVVSGRTDRQEYKLTKQVAVIGSQSDAYVKLTGYFVPKVAAMIARRGEGYYITSPDNAKKVQVNDRKLVGQTDLNDGDLLEVAGVKMYFYLKEAA